MRDALPDPRRGKESSLAPAAPSLVEFLGCHPWPKELSDKGSPLEVLWHFDLGASPEELWPILSDTSRLNRALGVTRMQFEEKNGLLHGRSRNAGFVQEWIEVPWSWVADRTLTNVRIYQKGFAHAVRAVYDLTPNGERTRVTIYFGWIPRGGWQRLILRIAMNQLHREYERALAKLEQFIGEDREQATPFVSPPAELESDALARLDTLRTRLIEDELRPALVDRIVDFVKNADDIDLYRIQVIPLARRFGLEQSELLGAFLKATRLGLFAMSWDVICPHCRGVRAEIKTLGEVPRRGDCKVCGIDFETDSENAIEITFHVHPSIRDVPKLFYCSAEPATKSHIKVQQSILPREKRTIKTALKPGRYRLRAGAEKRYALVEVSEEASSDVLSWSSSELPEGQRLAPMPTLAVENSGSMPRTFIVELPSWSDDAMKPSELLSFQEFRDLFTEEYVGSEVQLSVGRQTILFTDVVGSTALYATRGDPGAFVDVKRHFTEIYEVVRAHRGAIVKTIGDAAMAAFASPVDALRAAKLIHERLPPGREDLKIRVRASLNTGPCIAVNLNTNIDYFGNTVNIAAKIQACAHAGQIAFPIEVLEQPGVRDFLDAEGAKLVELDFTTPGVGQSSKIVRWDVNPT